MKLIDRIHVRRERGGPDLPPELRAAAEAAGKSTGENPDAFIRDAVERKLAALKDAEAFAARKERADLDAFDRILSRKGGQPPSEEDRLD